MANEKKNKNKNLVDKVTAPSSTAMAQKVKASKKIELPASPPEDEQPFSPLDEDEDDEDREVDEEEEKEDDDEGVADEEDEDEDAGENADQDEIEEEKNGAPLSWPKIDTLELLERIRKACPKDDVMKYDSRVNHVDWEAIKFGEYSSDQCKTRWLDIQAHLRHYRLLTEVLTDAETWVDRPWYNFNKGGKNNQKHPDQPKKPLTSYMLFYMEQKDAVLEKQPGLGMTELSKIIAKMYHELNDRKKQKYSEMAEKEKEAYLEKMRKFTEAHPDYVVPKSKQSSKPVPPKLPTPFKLFSDDKMAKLLAQGMSVTEAKERCREAYKELKDKQKLKWIYQALEHEIKYNEEMENFKAKYPDVEASAKKLSLLTKDELQIKHKHEGKPDKPPNSGYSLFSRKLLSSNALKQFESKERMTEISRLWKELSDDEKAAYNAKATQLNHFYKMKYASYLETLTPEQRNAELISSVSKNMKRVAGKKGEEEPTDKKIKISLPHGLELSDAESDGEVGSDEDDFELPPKAAIQKPNSSLQMFCDTNMEKYTTKHPKLTKQELTRLMAKEFAKLSEEKKKIYGNMAQKSKNEMPSSAKKEASTAPKAKAKAAKATPNSKKAAAKSVASATVKSSEPTVSPSKESTAKSELQAPKSPSKIKPSLNANAKSSAQKESSKTPKVPLWAANQMLFKTEKAKEPPKVPESAAAYYALTQHSKGGDVSSAEIDTLWGKVTEKQKTKYIQEHKKKQKEYVANFEKFVRSLNTEELKAYRAFMKKRELAQKEAKEAKTDESSDEEADPGSSNEDEVSGASAEDEEQMSSEED
ncbi:nucleolar transcription factor 1 isoform X2 [Daphnia magna]|uniref:nucleolar transcription factor 1 isoform X2 n=1 Tax=Daphnia magna TaxID=35525 RepID=UPI001E1BA9BF|nr:nucleolar transcription factor 1 isoform X2 [Daphnia magna]